MFSAKLTFHENPYFSFISNSDKDIAWLVLYRIYFLNIFKIWYNMENLIFLLGLLWTYCFSRLIRGVFYFIKSNYTRTMCTQNKGCLLLRDKSFNPFPANYLKYIYLWIKGMECISHHFKFQKFVLTIRAE